MTRAGFWAIGGAKLSFGKDGKWYADGEVIGNRRIAELFSQHLRRDGEGGWVIDIGIDRQPCEVEDTPLVVTSVDGDPASGIVLCVNDGRSDALDPATLSVSEENVLYCKLDRGERGVMAARFLRPAYYQLTAHMEEDEQGPFFRFGESILRLRPGSAVGGSGRL